MNRKLYLIRHSYAEDANGKKDIERRLTHEGQSIVRALGRHLINASFNPDIILCSTSERTKETAMNLVEELDMNHHIIEYKEVIYNASVREMLEVLNHIPDDHKEVAIIGHNPAITFFGEYLSGAAIGNMQPAGVVTIKFEKLKWKEVSQGTGIFEGYYHPKH
ncbi:MAG: histidine phosphatase family protein [Ekhidna sp.]|uniref:SixA phosphatase family protein n=1 Tax=Ekhidna sp. TaxID=2608089 RepID=UPI0032ECD324